MDDATDARTRSVLAELETLGGARCTTCSAPLCGHEAVMSLMLGFKGTFRCLGCLATGLGQPRERLGPHLREHASRRACWRAGWERATIDDAGEACLQGTPAPAKEATMSPNGKDEPAHDAAWDAGDMGCGDLVLMLRIRLQALDPGQVMKVTARDPGAPEDMPAWCGMTGHTLLKASHPTYWIRRK